jgi:hypothetical protein
MAACKTAPAIPIANPKATSQAASAQDGLRSANVNTTAAKPKPVIEWPTLSTHWPKVRFLRNFISISGDWEFSGIVFVVIIIVIVQIGATVTAFIADSLLIDALVSVARYFGRARRGLESSAAHAARIAEDIQAFRVLVKAGVRLSKVFHRDL